MMRAAGAFGDAGADDMAFYIGHGGYTLTYHSYVLADTGDKTYDSWIYPESEQRVVIFVLLWSCEQGNVIGGFDWLGLPYGMPHAWLHTTDLSSDGYANPDYKDYCFVGFDGAAPYLTYRGTDFTSGTSAYYPLYSFAVEFYCALLKYYTAQQYNVSGALDYASIQVWGVRFGRSVLYTGYTVDGNNGRMVVYGDGTLLLPYE